MHQCVFRRAKQLSTVVPIAITCIVAACSASAADIIVTGGQDELHIINLTTRHLIQTIKVTEGSNTGFSIPVMVTDRGAGVVYVVALTNNAAGATESRIVKIDPSGVTKTGQAVITSSASLLESEAGLAVNSMVLSSDGTMLYYGSPRTNDLRSGLSILSTETMIAKTGTLIPKNTPEFKRVLGITPDLLEVYFSKQAAATPSFNAENESDSALFFASAPTLIKTSDGSVGQIKAGKLIDPTSTVTVDDTKTTFATYARQVNASSVTAAGFLAKFSEITKSVSTIPVGVEPVKALLNEPAGNTIYVLNRVTKDISVVGTSATAPSATYSLNMFDEPVDMAINPAGTTLYAASPVAIKVISAGTGAVSGINLKTVKDKSGAPLVPITSLQAIAVVAAKSSTLSISTYQFILPKKASEKNDLVVGGDIVEEDTYANKKTFDKIGLSGVIKITPSSELKSEVFDSISINIGGVINSFPLNSGLAKAEVKGLKFRFRARIPNLLKQKLEVPRSIPFRLSMCGRFKDKLTGGGALPSSIPITLFVGGINFTTQLKVAFKDNGVVATASSRPATAVTAPK